MASKTLLDETLKNEQKEKFKGTFEILVKYHSNSNKHQLNETFDIWYEVFNSKVRIYSTLSAHFFYLRPSGMNQAGENVQIFLRNITLLKEIASEKQIDNLDDFSAFIEKIKDHIDLIGIQINRMDSGVEEIEAYKQELSTNIKKMQNEFNKTKKEYDRISKEIKKLENKQEKSLQKSKKLEKEFVTILGIFATILITTFGGLTSLASIFNNINNAGTGKLILMGSFIIFAVLLIVFLLLNGISKLAEINLRSCGCKIDEHCSCPIAKKHPTLYLTTSILIILAIFGLSEYAVNYKLLINNINQWGLLLIFFVTIFIFIVLAIVNFNDSKKRKYIE